MPKNWIQTGLVLIAVAIGVLLTFIAGLFTFMKATANPIHPDPKGVAGHARRRSGARRVFVNCVSDAPCREKGRRATDVPPRQPPCTNLQMHRAR